MLIEVVQTIATWLADPTHGVNALRLSVPRYTGDDVPPAVTVVHAFRNPDAARGQAPLTGLPALEVGLFQDPAQETSPSVRPYPADGEVTAHVRYLAAKNTATDRAVRDAALTLRCATRTLARFGVGGFSVNDVQLITVGAIRTLAMYSESQDTIVTGALVVTVRTRDLWTHPL
jgi:hypothetical protein